MQNYAINTAGNAMMWVLDSQPDHDSAVMDGGALRRWREGDPVPIRVLLDYDNAVDRCSRNPHRFRPEGMPDADHATLVKAFEERRS
jgi:hypothetical protein